VSRQATIVPDYRRPAALMVPHYECVIRPVLEAIAVFAARTIGVVLLSGDPERTRAFVAAQPRPERFSVVSAPFDSPWIRDRSPVAVRQRGGGLRWAVTRMQEAERPLDDVLFSRISRPRLDKVDLLLAQGNLVAGADGLAISTARVRQDNPHADRATYAAAAEQLGIRRWLVCRVFARDTIGHADVYARFLRPRLLAVAWSESLEPDRAVIADLEARVRRARPGVEILRLPMRSEGGLYASPLNWIQIDRTLLVPRYPLTPEEDVDRIASTLGAAGFRPTFVDSPTADLGGSLHCLTASIYADAQLTGRASARARSSPARRPTRS